MEQIVTTKVVDEIVGFIDIAKKDLNAEVECKLLAGKIQIKDTADRILAAIQTLAVGAQIEEQRLSVTYQDGTRVNVVDSHNIQKQCINNSYKEQP